MATLCFVDIETDGIHPGRKPWEIALVRVETDGTEPAQEWASYIDIDLSTADPFGLDVGRFYERHPKGRVLSGRSWSEIDQGEPLSVSTREAARKVARLTHGAHIVGAVPNFDTEVLAGLLRAEGMTPAWHYHLIDVENLAVGYLSAMGVPLPLPWSSDDLTAALGLPPVPEDDRHTARGDVRWAQAIYYAATQPRVTLLDVNA